MIRSLSGKCCFLLDATEVEKEQENAKGVEDDVPASITNQTGESEIVAAGEIPRPRVVHETGESKTWQHDEEDEQTPASELQQTMRMFTRFVCHEI